MTVAKNWCKLDIDTDKLGIDSNTNKHYGWNLVFAHHEEEDKIYPLTTIEIVEAQHKDQELKVYFKKNAKMLQKNLYVFNLLRTQKSYVRIVNLSFQHL